ncbi:MAG: hypothetical protein ACRDRJ_12120 [Streptosporangiaceae bacterium]
MITTISGGFTAAPVSTTSPYIVALIAVGGTIVGAITSSVTQSLTSRRASRMQLEAIQAQLDHQTQEALRQARRELYTGFLAAYDEWNALTVHTYSLIRQRRARRKLPDRSVPSERLTAALRDMEVIASNPVADYAARMYDQARYMMDKALNGESPDLGHSPEIVHPYGLIALMQKDLGVRDGIVLDPKTGFRAQGGAVDTGPIPNHADAAGNRHGNT